jgi:methionine biosynthesis protein MetW
MENLKNNKLLNIFKKKAFDPQNFGYDFYWATRKPGMEFERHRRIVNFIEQDSSVIDLACGEGTLLNNIKKKLSGTTVSGVDVSDTAIEYCAKRGLSVSKGNIDDPQFILEGNYDHIVISEALEHIVNPEDLLRKLKSNYNKSIIVTIPNTGYFMHRLSLLLGTFPVQWIHHPAEHLRFWTLSDFKNTLKILGYSRFQIHSIKGVGFLQRLWPSMFSAQTLFILEK